MEPQTDYTAWSNEELVKRVTELEAQLKQQNAQFATPKSVIHSNPASTTSSPVRQPFKKQKKVAARDFDAGKYSTRFTAFKFAYLGQRYNGLEYHANNTTPLPTVEEELFKAFMKIRLIFPTRESELKDGEVDWTGCDYSKCGRTDRGVSAFGQVIALNVRSNKPMPGSKKKVKKPPNGETQDGENAEEVVEEREWDHIRDELPYVQLMNRVLPEDIRMLAWLPSPPPGFSARFSCEERQYRYFFTNPAYAPVPGDRGLVTTATGKTLRDGCLDIEAMQDAAKRLEGLHDFRNFCKIDPAKQITSFERRIFHASVTEVDYKNGPAGYVGGPDFGESGFIDDITNCASHASDIGGPPTLYTFNVNGSAFLWHQVRHLVAIMFLVGQGLEPPSIISDLLDPEKTPTRPKYEMAKDAPLVLWDCIFPEKKGVSNREDALDWVHIGDEGGRETNKRSDADGGDGKFGRNGVMDTLWAMWHQKKIDEVLAGSMMDVVASQGRTTSLPLADIDSKSRNVRVYDGGHAPRAVGSYIPVMKKGRMEHFDVINARYRQRKGIAPRKFANKSMDINE